MIHVVTTFVLMVLMLGAMLATIPTTAEMVIAIFAIFVPLSFFGGLLGLVHAFRAAKRYGWQHRTEGLVVLSLLAITWAHDAGRAMFRRAGEMAGYHGAGVLESNDYRIWSGIALVIAGLLVVRWGTSQPVIRWWGDRPGAQLAAEVPWIAVGLGWTAFVVAGGEYLNRALVWLYLLPV